MADIQITEAQILGVFSYLGIGLQFKGNHWVAHSPFHKDDHASLWVYPSGFVIDYSGTFRGSLFKFFHELTGRFIKDVLPDLGIGRSNGALSWSIRSYATESASVEKKRGIIFSEERIIPVSEDVNAYRYCLSRGIDERLIEDWKITYAKRARVRGPSAPEPGKLITQRILIPIIENGEVWSIECRDVTRQDDKKVIYPPGCSVDTLFGIDSLDRKRPLVVVEGLMDLVKTQRAYSNSTCTFGIQVSKRQRALLNEFDRIILLPDSDEGGERFIEIMSELYHNELWVAHVPEKDPGDSTIETIGKSIDEARPLVEIQLRKAFTPKEKLLW